MANDCEIHVARVPEETNPNPPPAEPGEITGRVECPGGSFPDPDDITPGEGPIEHFPGLTVSTAYNYWERTWSACDYVIVARSRRDGKFYVCGIPDGDGGNPDDCLCGPIFKGTGIFFGTVVDASEQVEDGTFYNVGDDVAVLADATGLVEDWGLMAGAAPIESASRVIGTRVRPEDVIANPAQPEGCDLFDHPYEDERIIILQRDRCRFDDGC